MTEILSGTKFKCAFCKGTGIQPRSLYSKCIACRGRGEVTLKGPAIQCPSCKGTGKASNSSTLSCLRCKGIGVIEKAKIEKGLVDKELKKETLWLKNLKNKIKKEWEFLWKG